MYISKRGNQINDTQRSKEQANFKCGNYKSSDLSKAVIPKDQESRKLQIW